VKRAEIVLAALAAVTISCPCAIGQENAPQGSGSIRQQQLRYPRVRTASQEKDGVLRKMLEAKGLAYPPQAMLLRAFKKEGVLELWAAGSESGPFTLVKSYGICATSGVLGPKRRGGDEQVPEGFYDLDWFNPQSNFFLSMHINYPNASDRILGLRTNLGGTIYLHGNCASIGCIPITDDGIKEVYWLAVLVRDGGAKHLPLHIFPSRMNEQGLRELAKTHTGQSELMAFWSNLKEGFDAFEKDHRLSVVRVSKDGRYEFPREVASGGGR
jgi:murein L,D-transpeptidase YafK